MIKSFKRYLKEDQDKFYTLNLYGDMTKQEVIHYMNQLLILTQKMLKKNDVVVTVEPLIESEEDES